MTPNPDDTIAAVSSAAGPGRRAIVRLSGPNTRAAVAAVFRPELPPPRHLQPGTLHLSGVHSPLPADLYFFPGPRSYTGQDVAELHLISSPPLVERLVADLLAAGARPAQPGEFTLRAFLAGKKDLTQAEAVMAVIDAGTDAELMPALAQLAGGVARPLDRLRDDLLSLLADVEAGLDFVGEDITFVSAEEIAERATRAAEQLDEVGRQLDDRSVSGRPVRVVLAGRPNAGKSSLFNALAGGTPALVGPTAGTTRDYLTVQLSWNGVPVEMIDTAGRAVAADDIEVQAQALGSAQAARADVLVWCVPADEPLEEPPTGTALVVRTKADLLPASGGRQPPDPSTRGEPPTGIREHPPGREDQGADAPRSPDRTVFASALTPDGTAAVRETLVDAVTAAARPPLAPSQSRCRHHVLAATAALRRAADVVHEPHELVALELRTALHEIAAMTGAVHTDDLLDRIFSRFCIGK